MAKIKVIYDGFQTIITYRRKWYEKRKEMIFLGYLPENEIRKIIKDAYICLKK